MRWVLSFAFVSLGMCLPKVAAAQYKNSAFGLDAGAWFLTRPSVLDENNAALPAGERPLRFSRGVRIGGESNFKMDSDHWWFSLRVSLGGLGFSGDANGTEDERFDALANDQIGTVLGIEGLMGIRYMIRTDRVRPYLQAAVSYLRLMNFSSDQTCTDPVLCSGGINSQDAFLSTSNVGAFHIQPGLEWVVERNVALHLYLDIQRWVRISAADNWAPVLGAGVIFFS